MGPIITIRAPGRVVARLVIAWLLVVAAPAAAPAAALSDLYPAAALVEAQPRLTEWVRRLITLSVAPGITAAQRARLPWFELRFPLVGARGEALEPYTTPAPAGEPHAYEIHLPALSLLFHEDLSTAYAWYWASGYPLEAIDDYLALLKYRAPEDLPGGRHLPPLEALRVPVEALDDPRVRDVALRFRNTGYAFALAHELGHVFHRHRGPGSSGARGWTQTEEAEADRFALDVLQRTATVPVGAVLFLEAAARLSPNRWDFDSEAAWEAWLAEGATHPLTGGRLRGLAAWLDADPGGYAHGAASRSAREATADTVRLVADRIRGLAESLDDAGTALAIKERASRLTYADLGPGG